MDTVRATMRRVGAPDRVEKMIAARVEEALGVLHDLDRVPPRAAAGADGARAFAAAVRAS